MTGPIVFASPESSQVGRRTRLLVAILASLVLLGAVGVVEVGALAFATIVSASQNHGGGR